MELVAVDAAPAVQDLSPLASSTDEQIARALLEARGVAGTFLRIGREARPQFAWRAERLGGAIAAAIDDYFGGVFS